MLLTYIKIFQILQQNTLFIIADSENITFTGRTKLVRLFINRFFKKSLHLYYYSF